MRWQVSWDELTFATRSKEKGVNLLDGQRSEPYHNFFLAAWFCAPGWIRTNDQQIRSLLLFPLSYRRDVR